MFLANLFSRICSARAQFVIVVANQRASYLFSTYTIRHGVLVLRSARVSQCGVWSTLITVCPTGKHELDVCAGTVLVVFSIMADRDVFSKIE